MNSKRGWMILWGAVSALWIAYWMVLSISLGGEAIHEMLAGLDAPLLLSGLFLSLPLCTYGGGMLIAWLVRLANGKP
ncbi:MAG: hypothetical protein ACKVQK_17430 [Burkholderiales bacterium]